MNCTAQYEAIHFYRYSHNYRLMYVHTGVVVTDPNTYMLTREKSFNYQLFDYPLNHVNKATCH